MIYFLHRIRAGEWMPSKVPELAIAFTSVLCASRSVTFDFTLFISFVGTWFLLAFGYAWNDRCDWSIDCLAGKPKIGDPPSSWFCASLAVVFVTLSISAGAGRASVIVSTIISIGIAWSYSATPLRWKERGWAGLVIGSGGQRVMPLIVMGTATKADWSIVIVASIWLEIWGLRAMLIHQALDAPNDVRTGQRTWFIASGSNLTAVALLRFSVPVELGAFMAMISMTASQPVLGAAVVLISGLLIDWLIIRRIRNYGGQVTWLSFHHVPLSSIYFISGPVIVYGELLTQFGSHAIPWLFLVVLLNIAPIANRLDHFIDHQTTGDEE